MNPRLLVTVIAIFAVAFVDAQVSQSFADAQKDCEEIGSDSQNWRIKVCTDIISGKIKGDVARAYIGRH